MQVCPYIARYTHILNSKACFQVNGHTLERCPHVLVEPSPEKPPLLQLLIPLLLLLSLPLLFPLPLLTPLDLRLSSPVIVCRLAP